MKTAWNRHGETMIESLISMLIIGMVTAMLTMTVATVLRIYQQSEQTPTFVDGTLTTSSNTIEVSSDTGATVELYASDGTTHILDSGSSPVKWGVTVYKQTGKNGMDGGLYYYDP